MEKSFIVPLLLVFTLVTFSCKSPGLYLDVFSGNYSYSRGEFQNANLKYIKASSWDKYTDFISYDLGNVYYSLGEGAYALDKWEISKGSKDPGISFASYFNRGVLLYELSRYEEAFNSFKKALILKPESLDTKINLEYCLLKMNVSTVPKPKVFNNGKSGSKDKEDAMRVLDFVKRIEKKSFSKDASKSVPQGDVNDW